MLRYANHDIVFQEFPDEVTLAINLSMCPHRCPGCHSSYLQKELGIELNEKSLSELIDANRGITCVGFMGGDNDVDRVYELAKFIKNKYKNLHVGWYSGLKARTIGKAIDDFDYLKFGPYIAKLGPLNAKTTNQRLYKVANGKIVEDITYRFQK